MSIVIGAGLVLAFIAWIAVSQPSQAQELPGIYIQWEAASILQSVSIPRSDIADDLPWMSGSKGATTTVFWVLPSGLPDSFEFIPDDGRWSVGAPVLLGDLNRNGRVDIFDAISLLQIIVGLR